MLDKNFYSGKKILVTGHSGFKGTWMSKVLCLLGAEVTGYALEPEKESLFRMTGMQDHVKSIAGDIRDIDLLRKTFEENKPEIVIHMAAQPIVREGYKNPVYTYETNVMGTVNILECIRTTSTVKSFINVTTDKVYKNKEWDWGYRENEELNGFDPYSNSKSCSELVTESYKNSFFADRAIAISTARAGNVIGGGDFAIDRIIPDCVRAMKRGETIGVRNPYSIRPYQHVLEPVVAYLLIAQEQYKNLLLAGNYNVGPDECDCVTTGDLVEMFCRKWGDNAQWIDMAEKNAPHEAGFLKLDCSRVKRVFGWKPRWHIEECMDMVCRFGKAYVNNENLNDEMEREISKFFAL